VYVVLRVVMSQCELPFLLLSVLGRTCTDSSIFLFSVKSPEPPTTCREVNSMNLMMQSRHAMLRWVLWGTPGYSRVLQGTPGCSGGCSGVLQSTPGYSGVLRWVLWGTPGYSGVLRWVLRGTPGYSRVLRGAPVGALGLAIVGGAAQGTQCPRVSL
jgi:hypothetical protein